MARMKSPWCPSCGRRDQVKRLSVTEPKGNGRRRSVGWWHRPCNHMWPDAQIRMDAVKAV